MQLAPERQFALPEQRGRNGDRSADDRRMGSHHLQVGQEVGASQRARNVADEGSGCVGAELYVEGEPDLVAQVHGTPSSRQLLPGTTRPSGSRVTVPTAWAWRLP